MDFNPANPIVKRCLEGMALEENDQPEAAKCMFQQAWEEANEDHEKFLVAHYLARHQETVPDKLHWYETGLQYALRVNNNAVNSALPNLYLNIARCYEEMGENAKAAQHRELAKSVSDNPADKGPFYHGTRADLCIDDLLVAGYASNYQPEILMNHIYFTALPNAAGLAAALVKGAGRERVYIVEPTGTFENDPNVTDKKFPGNPTRSYRTREPLKIVGELTDWVRQSPEVIQKYRERLDGNKSEIIN